jgi:hypothetical protein
MARGLVEHARMAGTRVAVMKYKNDTVDNFVKVIGSDDRPHFSVRVYNEWSGYGEARTTFQSDDFIAALVRALDESVQALVVEIGLQLTKRQRRALT